MLLQKLRYINCEIETLASENSHQIQSFALLYLHEGQWFEVAEKYITPQLIDQASKALENDQILRPTKSPNTFYPVVDRAAVVVITFKRNPRKETVVKYEDNINESIQTAIHRFDAQHDILTGLCNQQTFSSIFNDHLENYRSPLPDIPTSAVSTPQVIALFAMDIDHFKQVNDTWGHVYGDNVIKWVANRLNCAAHDFQNSHSDIHIAVSRPSGEEFLVLAAGALSKSGIQELGQQILRSINSRAMPDEKEEKSAAGGTLPPLSAREITVSIGLATVHNFESVDNQSLIRETREKADLAMYVAKSLGRKRLIAFDDILKEHGSLVSHHKEMNIVVIDIGKNVGVRVGQEFLVYHPDFRGGVPIIKDDGRTKKTIGIYPKIPYGRIVATDVQNEISCCSVRDENFKGTFNAGSSLEAVPLGSIAHLLAKGQPLPIGASQPGKESDIEKYIDSVANTSVAIFSITNEAELIERFGSYAINEVLAELFVSMSEEFPRDSKTSIIGTNQIAAAGPSSKLNTAFLEEKLNTVSSKLANGAVIGAGYYLGETSFNSPGDKSTLSSKNGLEYAKIATSNLGKQPNSLLKFNEACCSKLVYRSRTGTNREQAYIDYEQLKSLGIENALVDQQLALACIADGRHEEALGLLLKAEQLYESPEKMNKNIKLNQAYVLCELGRFKESFEIFSSTNEEIEFPYITSFAYASYENYRESSNHQTHRAALDVVQKAIEAHDKTGRNSTYLSSLLDRLISDSASFR